MGRRPDGYHDLEAEMVSLDLADRLLVDPLGDGLEVVADEGSRASALGPADDNLVRRALAASGRTASVRLYKHVPVGGGLGGGSSDAAAILRWAGCADTTIAASLGGDVPFCLVGGRAMVSGIGERLAPLPYEPRSFVLLVPPFGVETAAVYQEWDRIAATGDNPVGISHPANDLTVAALRVEPRLAKWRDLLGETTGSEPVLAGSGSTWWVEGDLEELGLSGRTSLTLGRAEGRLLAVRTVPAGWSAPAP